jgi:hypothetical protein
MEQEGPYPGWSPEQPEPRRDWGPPSPVSGAAGDTGYGGDPRGPYAMSAAQAPAPPPVKPGVVPLRPLGLTEILDGAFSYIRKQPVTVLGIAAMVSVVSTLVDLVLSLTTVSGALDELAALDETASIDEVLGAAGGVLGGSALSLLIATVFQVLGTGLLTIVMARSVLGQDISIGEAWTRSRPLLLPLIGLVALSTLGWLAGALACLIPGVFLYVAWSLAPPALMLERVGIITALRRSWTLVLGSWWRVFGILALATLIATFVGQAVATPFALLGALLDGLGTAPADEIPLATLLLSSLGTLVAGVITLPFTAGVTALLYVDLRMRREGLDLALQRATTDPQA